MPSVSVRQIEVAAAVVAQSEDVTLCRDDGVIVLRSPYDDAYLVTFRHGGTYVSASVDPLSNYFMVEDHLRDVARSLRAMTTPLHEKVQRWLRGG